MLKDDSGLRFVLCADAALRADFGAAPSAALTRQIAAVHHSMCAAPLRGVIESIPGLVSLTVLFDPDSVTAAEVQGAIQHAAETAARAAPPASRWTVPVCYDEEFSPDLDVVATATGLTRNEVIAAHTAREYVCYVLGFSPGWAYLGDIDRRLVLPRRADPRPRVPAGSVAIAASYTGVYPQDTAGGWHLLGHTPLRFFDAAAPSPVWLTAGDTVCFRAVTRAEHDRLASEVESGRYRIERAPQ